MSELLIKMVEQELAGDGNQTPAEFKAGDTVNVHVRIK